jgi:uncharacterized phiE125 gp8 family phage protein
MGNLSVVDRDNDYLPGALLALAKMHMRIVSTTDDVYIKNVILRAINEFEIKTDTLLNPVELQWSPVSGDFNTDLGWAVIPETPLNVDAGWTVKDGTATDVSANYQLLTVATKGVGRYALGGSFVSGMMLDFNCGYDDISQMPGGIQNAILLYTGYLYENREGQITTSWNDRWLNFIAQWWKPSV